ncbi:MAG: glycosyltransferase [Candidatus Daviesbacteria bacterium]|nr:MAG: glycosyltransferase [Candidatus Daviesbacteria bacterium]
MQVALVHDYLKEYGGAERVVEVLAETFPEAPLYTAYYDLNGLGKHRDRFKNWTIKSSFLQWIPGAGRLISPLRLLAPKIFESFNLSDYDVVISSCNVYFSKAVKTNSKQLHISYIHTPPRYLYGYTTSFNYKKNPLVRIVAEIMNHFLRIVDFTVSQQPDILVANSKNVAERIKKFYRRDSIVIYPPVEIAKVTTIVRTLAKVKKSYFLSVGRLVKGKGIDVIVKTCAKLGLPLKVVGTGPELNNLQKILDREDNKTIEFLGQVSDEQLPKLYAGAIATIVASEDEDFGIVPVESMAVGTPVIAVKAGGFLETVVDGKTGQFFNNATIVELMKVLQDFDPAKYRAEDCKKQAEKFSKERFQKEIRELIKKNWP